jgi:hypothetical protein
LCKALRIKCGVIGYPGYVIQKKGRIKVLSRPLRINGELKLIRARAPVGFHQTKPLQSVGQQLIISGDGNFLNPEPPPPPLQLTTPPSPMLLDKAPSVLKTTDGRVHYASQVKLCKSRAIFIISTLKQTNIDMD